MAQKGRSDKSIRVINVAEDTISVVDESITVQNESNF